MEGQFEARKTLSNTQCEGEICQRSDVATPSSPSKFVGAIKISYNERVKGPKDPTTTFAKRKSTPGKGLGSAISLKNGDRHRIAVLYLIYLVYLS